MELRLSCINPSIYTQSCRDTSTQTQTHKHMDIDTHRNTNTQRPVLLQWRHRRLTWWRHQMETFSALLAICAGNSPVPVNPPHKGQCRGALMFSLIYAWINGWVNNREAGDLRRHRAHYDVIVMKCLKSPQFAWLFNNPLMLTATTKTLWPFLRGIHRCAVASLPTKGQLYGMTSSWFCIASGESFTAEDGCNTCHCEENPDGTLVAICTSMACINDNLCVANNITYSEGRREWKISNLLERGYCKQNLVVISAVWVFLTTAVVGATILVSCNIVKSLQLIWRSGTRRWNLRVPDLQMSCSDLTFMMTSSNGNIFRVTGPLCGEFTGHWGIPRTKASDAGLWCFLWSAWINGWGKEPWGWWFETPSRPLWRHCNVQIGHQHSASRDGCQCDMPLVKIADTLQTAF